MNNPESTRAASRRTCCREGQLWQWSSVRSICHDLEALDRAPDQAVEAAHEGMPPTKKLQELHGAGARRDSGDC